MEPKNIIICGVGGQGILLASELLSMAAMEAGYDVKKSEVHGMAQRGGSVVSHVRMAERVHSPLVEEGTGDVILSFEKGEGLRYVQYLKPGEGICIVNDLEIIPLMVTSGFDTYPKNVIEHLQEQTKSVHLIDGMSLAREAGDPRTLNVAFLGALSNFLDIPDDIWKVTIERRVPKKTIEMNLRAFEMGKKAVG
jgi:indolepyruvate ferredoxin oxidoreductase beta subunit